MNDIGIICGTRPLGTGMLLTKLQKPHDGMISCAECQNELIKHKISLDVTHTTMLFSTKVVNQVVTFIRYHG